MGEVKVGNVRGAVGPADMTQVGEAVVNVCGIYPRLRILIFRQR